MAGRGRIGSHSNGRRLLIVTALLLAIAATAGAILIQRSPEPQPPIAATSAAPAAGPAAPAPAQPAVRALPPREQLARAFETAFGKRESATITLSRDENGGFPERVEFRPGALIWPDFGPVLVSEGEVVDAAHASSGKIAIHYLAPEGEGFRIVRSVVPAVETGSSGRVGRWRTSDAFTDRPVLLAEGGGTWQGYSCRYVTLAELAPDGVTKLARFPISYSDAGAVVNGRPTTIDGKITNVVKNRSFEVSYSGSRTFTDHYERRDGGYVRTGGPSQIEGC